MFNIDINPHLKLIELFASISDTIFNENNIDPIINNKKNIIEYSIIYIIKNKYIYVLLHILQYELINVIFEEELKDIQDKI